MFELPHSRNGGNECSRQDVSRYQRALLNSKKAVVLFGVHAYHVERARDLDEAEATPRRFDVRARRV